MEVITSPAGIKKNKNSGSVVHKRLLKLKPGSQIVHAGKNMLHFYVLYPSENIPPSRPQFRATPPKHMTRHWLTTSTPTAPSLSLAIRKRVSYIFYSNEYIKKKKSSAKCHNHKHKQKSCHEQTMILCCHRQCWGNSYKVIR